ncbi:hypothetical protein BJX99DRAFT_261575 [Aspergillus californicus]
MPLFANHHIEDAREATGSRSSSFALDAPQRQGQGKDVFIPPICFRRITPAAEAAMEAQILDAALETCLPILPPL